MLGTMFVTLEGPEGAGKSTLQQALGERLRKEEIPVLLTREPGGSSLGAILRQALLDGADLDSRAELFMFLADRAEHVAKVIRPALQDAKTVICDRFTDSTLAYQGYGRGLDLDLLRDLNDLATGALAPDLTLLLDIDPTLGLSRLQNKDRLDCEPLAFHRRVREGFLQEARRQPSRWQVIDASADSDSVTAAAVAAVLEKQAQHT